MEIAEIAETQLILIYIMLVLISITGVVILALITNDIYYSIAKKRRK